MAGLSSSLKPLYKLLQKQLYSFVGSWFGCFVIVCGCFFVAISIINTMVSPCNNILRGANSHCSDYDFSDNIGGMHMEKYLAYGPIDVVYSWVNGSDPIWLAKKSHWYSKTLASRNVTLVIGNGTTEDDTNSHNRYRDSEELRYSLRSLEKYAPWVRNIYLVTDNQIPYWLNVDNPRLHVIPHRELFPNRSDLPVFSSPAIESHLHRIPGLSKKFIYFNDDVFLGTSTLPEDFYSLGGAQKLYFAWDVPKCAPGCSDSWIGDGYCDKACNVSACNFDYPDCVNGTSGKRTGGRGSHTSYAAKEAYFCAAGCPDSWLGDKVCDSKCKSVGCGWDAGDCGVELVAEDFEGRSFLTSDYEGISIVKERQHKTDGVVSSTEVLSLLPPPRGTNSSARAAVATRTSDAEDEYYPLALTVRYGSRGVYFNLSYLPCEALYFSAPSRENSAQTLFPFSAVYSPTCSEDNILSPFGHFPGRGSYNVKTMRGELPPWSNFTYSYVNYTLAPVQIPTTVVSNASIVSASDVAQENLVATANYLQKHHLLIVLLHGHVEQYNKEAENAKKNISHPIDIRFEVGGYSAVSNVNITARFTLRILPKAPELADLSIPEGMDKVDGHSASCELGVGVYGRGGIPSSRSEDDILFVHAITHLTQPFRLPSLTASQGGRQHPEEGIVLAVDFEPLSFKMFHTSLSQISVASSVTLLNGTRFDDKRPLCGMVADLDHFHKVKHRSLIKGTNLCHANTTLGALLFPDSDHSLTSYPRSSLLILVHMPVFWNRLVSQDVDSAEHVFVSLDIVVEESIVVGESRSLTAMCIQGVYSWGLKMPHISQSNSSLATSNLTLLNATSGNHTNHTSEKNTTVDESATPPPKVDTYASSLRFVNGLYHTKFGSENRKVPAHMPHMIDVEIMEEMQILWKNEWRETSRHRFRSPTDMQYAFAYYYYLVHRNKANPPDIMRYITTEIDTDGDGYLSDNEFLTLASIVYKKTPSATELQTLRNCTSENYTEIATMSENLLPSNDTYSTLHSSHVKVDDSEAIPKNLGELEFPRSDVAEIRTSSSSPHGEISSIHQLRRYPSVEDVGNCSLAVEALIKNVDWPLSHRLETDKDVAFEMIGDNITDTLSQLNSIRYRKTKFVCVNDQMEDPSPELQQVLKDFFLSFFPHQSQFELPPSRRNPTLYYDEYMEKYSVDASAANKALHMLYAVERQANAIASHAFEIWRGLIRYLNDITESEARPKSALDSWSRKRSSLRPPVEPQQEGVRVFIPYWVMSVSIVGLYFITCLRGSMQRNRRGVGSRSCSDIDEESQSNMGSGFLEKSASLELEKKMYYGTVEEAGTSSGGEDLLNSLWRSVGYGSKAGSSTKGRKRPQLESFLKDQHGSQNSKDSPGVVSFDHHEDDEVSISTLGMEEFDGQFGEFPSIEESNSPGGKNRQKGKTVRWGGVSTAGEKESGSVTKMFRGIKGKVQGSLHKKTS